MHQWRQCRMAPNYGGQQLARPGLQEWSSRPLSVGEPKQERLVEKRPAQVDKDDSSSPCSRSISALRSPISEGLAPKEI